MKKIKILYTILVLLAAGKTVSASDYSAVSGYFLRSNIHGHTLNPAFAPDVNFYLGAVGIGGISAGINGNVGISDFLYPKNGNLHPFWSESVSSEEFIGRLPDKIKLGADFSMNILSFGIKSGSSFNTLEIKLNTGVNAYAASSILKVMKEGIIKEDGVYDLGKIGFSGSSHLEIALGYSRQINDRLRIGGKIKGLFGLLSLSSYLDNIRVIINEEKTEVSAEQFVSAASIASPIVKKQLFSSLFRNRNEAGNTATSSNSAIEFKRGDFFPCGYGGAVDFGALYSYGNLRLSASVTDFGFIRWSGFVENEYKEKFSYNGISDDRNIEKELKEIRDRYEENVKKSFNYSNNSEYLYFDIFGKLNIGLQYYMPFYEKMSVGLLNMAKFSSVCKEYESRLYANLEPVSWFSCSANAGYSSYGPVVGWIVRLHPKVLDLYVGTDYQPLNLAPKYYLPLNKGGLNVYAGLNICF